MNRKQYDLKYRSSIKKPEQYWEREAERLQWHTKWKQVVRHGERGAEWFVGGSLNITETCLEKQLNEGRGDKIAYIEINELDKERRITYKELLAEVERCANAFKKLGVKCGDVVAIYMPTSFEQVIAMLAAARIGALHSVVFAGLSAEALRDRMKDAHACLLITADGFERRGVSVDMLSVAREARRGIRSIKNLIVLQRLPDAPRLKEREHHWEQLLHAQPKHCHPMYIKSTDPLFVLYTSGSTGKPKGVVHSAGGYGVFVAHTMAHSFDLRPRDIFWCTADSGWITGHSYLVYGPLMNGATTLIVAGPPDYPVNNRWWDILEKYKVTILYTSPTAIRLLRMQGTKFLRSCSFKALRIIGSVGEPLNPDVAQWYKKYVGKLRAHLADTWWQTETGGHMITTFPGLQSKNGAAGLPVFGIDADVVDTDGVRSEDNKKGLLVIRNAWPGALQGCLNDVKKFKEYRNEQGFFVTGDIAMRDTDGYFRILGRYDDVIKVSGHRIGSAELEHAVLQDSAIGEVAAIGIPHAIKGEAIKLFCVLQLGQKGNNTIKTAISARITRSIGRYARPEEIVFVSKLPKTRSGKIMRRLLRKREQNEPLGDLSTLDE